ncbi:MAG: hypothetical protein AB7P33_12865, partial [Dehalococcoidia bacterium]
MTQREPREDATTRAASLIAQALAELQEANAVEASEARKELAANRAAIQELTANIERHLVEEREQNVALGGQLSTLAGSLDRLVNHLQGLSSLMSDLLGRLAEPAPAGVAPSAAPEPQAPAEAPFQPGGEGVSLTIVAVPGFQALMEIQKALTAVEQVAHASVERFQEGDSRLLVGLTAPITGTDLVTALIRATGQAMAIEESKPELARLRVKVVP